jgi:hypothetical protein
VILCSVRSIEPEYALGGREAAEFEAWSIASNFVRLACSLRAQPAMAAMLGSTGSFLHTYIHTYICRCGEHASYYRAGYLTASKGGGYGTALCGLRYCREMGTLLYIDSGEGKKQYPFSLALLARLLGCLENLSWHVEHHPFSFGCACVQVAAEVVPCMYKGFQTVAFGGGRHAYRSAWTTHRRMSRYRDSNDAMTGLLDDRMTGRCCSRVTCGTVST